MQYKREKYIVMEGVNGHIIMEHLGKLVCITYITNEKPRRKYSGPQRTILHWKDYVYILLLHTRIYCYSKKEKKRQNAKEKKKELLLKVKYFYIIVARKNKWKSCVITESCIFLCTIKGGNSLSFRWPVAERVRFRGHI